MNLPQQLKEQASYLEEEASRAEKRQKMKLYARIISESYRPKVSSIKQQEMKEIIRKITTKPRISNHERNKLMDRYRKKHKTREIKKRLMGSREYMNESSHSQHITAARIEKQVKVIDSKDGSI